MFANSLSFVFALANDHNFILGFSFLPRDACVSTVFAVVRRPSVCLSVTFVYYVVKLLSRPGSPIILVFGPKVLILNSKRNPFSGGVKYTGVGKLMSFLKTKIVVYIGNGAR